MEEKDKKFMALLGKRLTEIEDDIRHLKNGKQINVPLPPVIPALPTGSRAASKFFGSTAPVAVATEPQCNVDIILKDPDDFKNKEVLQEVTNGQKMLRQAVMEFCEEFDIKEFKIEYTDPTPLKDD